MASVTYTIFAVILSVTASPKFYPPPSAGVFYLTEFRASATPGIDRFFLD